MYCAAKVIQCNVRVCVCVDGFMGAMYVCVYLGMYACVNGMCVCVSMCVGTYIHIYI